MKRKKENKLVVNWITREDILSSYFVPEERVREEARQEQNIKNALGFYKDGVDLKIILKNTGLIEKELNDILKEYEKV